MKNYYLGALTLILIAGINLNSSAQHLSTLYNHDGDDFDFSVTGMVGHGDSIYFTRQNGGTNNTGALYKMTEDGMGMEIIFSFEANAGNPLSLAANDTMLLGTTQESANGGGSLFKYSFSDYSLEFLYDFSSTEGQDIHIKMLTDTAVWCIANSSTSDNGSVFSIKYDGTGFEKFYNNTNVTLGQAPTDFQFIEDKVFISFYSGGGIPYDNGGGSTYSGSINSVDLDGLNYTSIVKGQDDLGTNPYDLFQIDGKLYGAFTGAGTDINGRIFKVNTDGSNYQEIATFENNGRTGRGSIHVFNGRIYASTSSTLLRIDEGDTLIKMAALDYENTGTDVGIGGIPHNDAWFFGTRQGGNGGTGGGIVKWENHAPTVESELSELVLFLGDGFSETDLSNFFTDSDEDELKFSFTSSNEAVVKITQTGSILKMEQLTSGMSLINIIAEDDFGGSAETSFNLIVDAPPTLINSFPDTVLTLGFETFLLDLDKYFSDVDNGEVPLEYEISTSSEGTIEVSLDQNIASFQNISYGVTAITVKAKDVYEGEVETSFDFIVNSLPSLQQEFPDTVLTLGFETFQLDLDKYFSDVDNGEVPLEYEISTSSEGIIEVSLDQNIASFQNISYGVTAITVKAKDIYEGEVETSFDFIVNSLPSLQQEFPDTVLTLGFETFQLDLDKYFSDVDNGEVPLEYEISTSVEGIIGVSTDQNIASFQSISYGVTAITVKAKDVYEGEVETSFDFIVNSLPSLKQEFPDTVLTLGFETFQLDLDKYFSDVDNGEVPLEYEISTSSEGTIEVSLDQNIASFQSISYGVTAITVKAKDVYEGEVETSFDFIVNSPPTTLSNPADTIVTSGFDPIVIDLAAYFEDKDDESLTYELTAVTDGVVNISLTGSVASISEVAIGSSIISIVATDGYMASTTAEFNIVIEKKVILNSPAGVISIYPNPASEKIWIDSNNDLKTYEILNIGGVLLKSGKVTSQGIDISQLNEGVYLLRLTVGSVTVIKRVIVGR